MAGWNVATVADWIGSRLLAGSIEACLVIGVVWLGCRRAESMPPWARASLWWLVSLKLVLVLAPLPAVSLPLLPPPAAAARVSSLPTAVMRESAPAAAPAPRPGAIAGAARAQSAPPFPWVSVLVAAWLLGVVAQAARLVRARVRLSGVVSRAVPIIDEAWVPAGRMARDIGLRRVPSLRLSAEIDTPQVSGLLEPIVLMPASAHELTPDERAMTVCHELMHVRHRDLALGWIPVLAERLFFFHPLARLAAREYLLAREAACDAAVVRALDVAPQDYGRLLIRLGVARSDPGFSAAGSSHSSSCLTRRLAMLDRATSSRGRHTRLLWLALALFALSVVPVRLVAQMPPAAHMPSTTIVDARVLPSSASHTRPATKPSAQAGASMFVEVHQREMPQLVVSAQLDAVGQQPFAGAGVERGAHAQAAKQSEAGNVGDAREHGARRERQQRTDDERRLFEEQLAGVRERMRELDRTMPVAQPSGQAASQDLAAIEREIARASERARELAVMLGSTDSTSQNLQDSLRETQTSLRLLAEETDGVAVVNQDYFVKGRDPERHGGSGATALDIVFDLLVRSEADAARHLDPDHPKLVALRAQLEELRARRQQTYERAAQQVYRGVAPFQQDSAVMKLKDLMSLQELLARQRDRIAEQQKQMAEQQKQVADSERSLVRQIQFLIEQIESQKK